MSESGDALREIARQAFTAAVKAADPHRAVRRHLTEHAVSMGVGESLGVFAVGKAAPAMQRAALDHCVEQGIEVAARMAVTHLPPRDGDPQWVHAEHPVPGPHGLAAANELERLARTAEVDAWWILLSGGASAMLPAPAGGLSLRDKQLVTQALLRSGASIHQLNTVRKHLSRLKGGGLARLLAPKPVLVLVLSDVFDDDLSVIGSGPLSADSSTYAEACALVRELPAAARPPNVVEHLQAGLRGELPETVKPSDPVLAQVSHYIVSNNRRSVEAAAQVCRQAGYETIVGEPLQGLARAAGRRVAERAMEVARRAGRWALLYGGETTVEVRADGKGGRNQEVALSAALRLAEVPFREGTQWAVLAAGTDGRDGPTDAAGACVQRGDLGRLRAAGLDGEASLDRNDSYSAHAAMQTLLRTGDTGTNVADVTIVLIDG